MRKLLAAVWSVAKHRRPFVPMPAEKPGKMIHYILTNNKVEGRVLQIYASGRVD
jgi:hypothetical protein